MRRLMEYKIVSGNVVEIRRTYMNVRAGSPQRKPRGQRIAGNTSARKIKANENEAVKQLARTLKEQHLQHPSKVTRAQIDNLRRRLHLTRSMQALGVSSLFLCVVTMFLIYVGMLLLSAYVFGAALLLLIASLGVSLWEIQISVRALDIHLKDMESV